MTSATNQTTRNILNYLFSKGIFAWREDTTGLFDPRIGRFRPAAKTGKPDIMAILPGGKFLGIEVKTGVDKLRPEQVGFIANTEKMGAKVLVVKDFDDFLDKIKELS